MISFVVISVKFSSDIMYAVIRDDSNACFLTLPKSGLRESFYYLPSNKKHVMSHVANLANAHDLLYKTREKAKFEAELHELLEG